MEEDATPGAASQALGSVEDFDIEALDTDSQEVENEQPAETEDKSKEPKADKPKEPEEESDPSTPKETSDVDKKTEEADKGAPALQIDDDLKEWAVKRGYAKEGEELSERELRMAQDVRNNQKEFSREKNKEALNKATELQKVISETSFDKEKEGDPAKTDEPPIDTDLSFNDLDVDPDDPVAQRLARLEAENAARAAREAEREAELEQFKFFSGDNVSDEEAIEMGEILKEFAKNGDKRSHDFYTDPKNLSQWHKLARANIAERVDTTDIEEKAAQREREKLANTSKATAPKMSASSVSTSQKRTQDDEDQELLEAGLK